MPIKYKYLTQYRANGIIKFAEDGEVTSFKCLFPEKADDGGTQYFTAYGSKVRLHREREFSA
jgi:hypothetical protein